MPDLLEQDIHQIFSPLHSAQNNTKKKPMESIFTPKKVLIHKKISFSEDHRDSGAKALMDDGAMALKDTDGSKSNEGTGSAYCILENCGIIAS
ncbi:hypothetical protein AVEN_122037-1 [Araneus ventricosus]|uniref:Uncharacterized protein n=1 Tax=Araneus ventricosus TaxID=182803 RepID=A0A4Y2EZF3_ARAVE|nr:hypothetical protein AVEN_122037-1 [Araneus ventricosus]